MKNIQKYIDIFFITVYSIGLLFQIYLWANILIHTIDIARQYIWAYSVYVLIPTIIISILYMIYLLQQFIWKYKKKEPLISFQPTTRWSLFFFLITLVILCVFELYISH